ncbi:MAG TPA: PAS domain S-box protein, partial [Candidatus Omnitrophota bacterium]|nr:PAS domain S-box protein [Candidatus Omnitrophota bacterium]
FFGYTEKEILGKSVIGTIISPSAMNEDNLVLVINQIANQKSDFHFRENENIKKDGTLVWMSWSNRGIFDDKGALSEILCVGVDETEQKRARQEVEENRRLLDMAVRGAYLGMFDWDIRSGKMFFNDIWWRMLGFNKNELKEDIETWMSLLHPEDKEAAEKTIYDYLQGRRAYYVSEYRVRTKDGSWRWILDRGQIIERDAAGQPLRMVGLHQDITVRKNAEAEKERLLRSLNRLTAVMNNTSDYVSISNMEGQIIYINDAGARMLGMSGAGEVLDRMTWRQCHPKSVVEQIESVGIPKAIEAGTWSAESVLVRKDGLMIPVVQVLIPIYDDHGKVEAIGTTMSDISEIKRFEDELKEQASKLQEAQQVARLGHWEIDPERRSLFRSDIVAEIFGTDPVRPVRTYDEFLKFVHPDDRAQVDVVLTHSMQNRTAEETVFRILRSSGEVRYVQAKCHTVYDEQKKRIRCTGTLQDITEMKKGEDALRYQKELLTTLIENMPLAVYAKDVQDDYRFIMWNKEMERLFGLKRHKVLGKNDHDLFEQSVADFYRRDDEKVIGSHAIRESSNATIRTVFGERHAYTVKIPIYNAEGKATILFGILEDITDRLDMESQLRQNQKMQAIGQLAAGVAHEVKNPLAIILLAAEGLALNKIAAEDQRFQNKLRMIKEAADRANRVVLELLKFSRLSSGDEEEVDLHKTLEG